MKVVLTKLLFKMMHINEWRADEGKNLSQGDRSIEITLYHSPWLMETQGDTLIFRNEWTKDLKPEVAQREEYFYPHLLIKVTENCLVLNLLTLYNQVFNKNSVAECSFFHENKLVKIHFSLRFVSHSCDCNLLKLNS